MTANIVNLNKARKARASAEKQATADANRVRFGRPKAERSAEAVRRQAEAAALDGAERVTPRLDEAHDDLDPGTVS